MNKCTLALAVLILATTGACGGDDDGGSSGQVDDYCATGGGAYFRATLSGAANIALDEVAGGFGCGGVSAQDGTKFSMSWGQIATTTPGAEFSFILTITATEAMIGTGFSARFSTTRGAADDGSAPYGLWSGSDGDCAVALTEHSLQDESAVGDLYRVSGTGSCVQLASDDLTIESFEFSGVTVWM